MFEYLKNLDKDSLEFISESVFAQFELDKSSIENEYEFSNNIFDITLNSVTESGDDNEIPESKRAKFAKKIKDILKAICAAIGKVLDGISNKLLGEKSKNIHDYLNSREGEIRLNNDIRKIQEECIKSAREADKLVQAISKGTGISDEKVDNFLASINHIFGENFDAIISASAATAIYARQIEIYDGAKKAANEDGVYRQCKTMEGQSQINRVLNGVSNMYAKEAKEFAIFMTEFDKLSKKNKED